MLKIATLICLIIGLSGCIRTLDQIQEEAQRSQVMALQEEKASLDTQVNDLQEDLRMMAGRLETLERQSKESRENERVSTEEDKKIKENRLKAYEETLAEVEAKNRELKIELEALKSVVLSKGATNKKTVKKSTNPFSEAEALFKKKDWQKAILGYQKYRESHPKGKFYKLATYKIGVCFQELNMRSEAKAFFDEVIERFPKTSEASKAAVRLKSLKK
jgi:TolA-binding protein